MYRSPITAFLSFCMLVGCDPESSLGELPGTTAATTDATGTTGTTGASGEADSAPADGDSTGEGVGEPCELGDGVENVALGLDEPECRSGMCLYANSQQATPSQPCTKSSDCDGFTRGVICGESGFCQIDPDYVVARTMCTDTCVEDSDCVTVDGSACRLGFVCVPIARLGEACCQPVCACRDDFDESEAISLEFTCANGSEACCQIEEPTPEACGG